MAQRINLYLLCLAFIFCVCGQIAIWPLICFLPDDLSINCSSKIYFTREKHKFSRLSTVCVIDAAIIYVLIAHSVRALNTITTRLRMWLVSKLLFCKMWNGAKRLFDLRQNATWKNKAFWHANQTQLCPISCLCGRQKHILSFRWAFVRLQHEISIQTCLVSCESFCSESFHYHERNIYICDSCQRARKT